MKGGQTPIHIMRWAPADYVNDPFVRRLYQREDYRTLAFYSAFLFYSHLEGGDLPADVQELSAIVLMPSRQVRPALRICVRAGKVMEHGGRLYHKRVKREVIDELEYRRGQAELGKMGGRPRRAPKGDEALLRNESPSSDLPSRNDRPTLTKGATHFPGDEGETARRPVSTNKEEGEPKGTILDTKSPPSPSSSSSSAPASSSSSSPAPEPFGERPPNPLVDRDALVREGHELITLIAGHPDVNLDPTEVLAKASEWNGRGYVRLDTMRDDRLAHTVNALRRWKRQLQGEEEPAPPPVALPPARAAPPSLAAQRRQQQTNAELIGGMRGDGTIPGIDRRAVEGRVGGAEGEPAGAGDDARAGAPPRKQLPARTGSSDE